MAAYSSTTTLLQDSTGLIYEHQTIETWSGKVCKTWYTRQGSNDPITPSSTPVVPSGGVSAGPTSNVAITNPTLNVTGPLTNTELRASPVPVSGTVAVSNPGLTDGQLRATPVNVTGPLTDTQLRASVVPVTVSNFPATVNALTDTQLRASAVPVTTPTTTTSLSITSRTVETTAGGTASGLYSVSFINVGSTNAVVAGAALLPNQSIAVEGYYDKATNVQYRLAPIAYTASSTAVLHITTQS